MARKKADPKPIEETELTEQTAELAEQPAQEIPPESESVTEGVPEEAALQEGAPDDVLPAEGDPLPEPDTPLPDDVGADAAEPPPDAEPLLDTPPDDAAEDGADAASPVFDAEEDYDALLGEANGLGLNSHADAEEPLTLPESSGEQELTPSDGIEGRKLTEAERRTLNEYANNSASAARVREREQPARESTAAQPRRDTRILTIDAHDEVLTEAEHEEMAWHEIRNSYIAQQMLTGTLDSLERTPSGFTVAVVTYKGFRIAIPLKEMLVLPTRWPSKSAYEDAIEQLPRVINARMGCEIDFIVKGIDNNDRSVVASRRSAMLHKRQTFYMNRADTGEPMIYPGRVVQARVLAVAEKTVRIEVFGVECSIRASGISWEWIGNAKDFYAVGDRVLVRVLTVDRPNLLNISITADIRSTSKTTTLDNLHKCRPQNRYVGRVTDNYGGVVFIRLNNGVNAIAHTCRDARRPGRKDDVSFFVTKLDEEKGVAVGIITKIIRQNL